MKALVDVALSRMRMIAAFIVLSVVAGWAAYTGLPKEGAPNIDVPVIYVSVSYPGVSALDAERLLVKPLEIKLRTLEGLKELQGIASEGHASVVMEFDFGFDKDAILAEVREEVDAAKAEFPADANEPTVNEVNTSQFPVLVVTLAGDAPDRTLLALADQLQDVIETVPAVLEATLSGDRTELLEVIIDPLKLEAYNITAGELIQVINNNNQIVAAGAIDTGRGKFSVKLPGAIETAQDVFSLPIKVNGDSIVTLGDIAEIRRTFEDPESIARFNGQPTVALQVKKRSGENIIATVTDVRAKVDALVASWPDSIREAVEVKYSLDESIRVQSMVDQLQNSVLTAIALVMVVVVAALGLRSALLVGLAIPTSFLLAFALLSVLGMSVNNMVMFGLILAVGMLVDGAIVVVEYADLRQSQGAPPDQAFGEAAKRMFWPIVASTATTLCAFLPMLFWPGMPGQFMRYLPITLIFVLSASLLVALIFLPVTGVLVAKALHFITWPFRSKKPKPVRYRAPRRRRGVFGWFLWMIVSNPIMPLVVIGLTGALLAASFTAFGKNNYGVEFFVDTDPEVANLSVRARGNLSVEEKDVLMKAVEKRVMDVEDIASVFTVTGGQGIQNFSETSVPADSIGTVQFELKDWKERRKGVEVLEDIRARVSDMPGIYLELAEQSQGPAQGKPIQIEVGAPAYDDALNAAKRVKAHLENNIDGLKDIDDTFPLPGIEWRLDIDRTQAGRFGADVATVGAMVQLATRGVMIGSYRPDDSDDEIDIRARFPEEDRAVSTLDTLRVRTQEGLVPVANFVTREAGPKLAEITRRDGMRVFTIRADVELGVNANAKIEEISAWLLSPDADLGPGAVASFRGDAAEQAESQAFLSAAFSAALGLMFIILLAQFNSFYNAVLVLLAVVLSVGGVLVGMMVMGQPFSIIMTGVGIVALAGIVVNNNIVLIDTYQDLSQHMPRIDAIIETGVQRLRPVFVTTITTIAGLLPMMFAVSIDFANRDISVGAPTALWWTQLATAIVFGLGFATLLTLVVTPSMLALRVWYWSTAPRVIFRTLLKGLLSIIAPRSRMRRDMRLRKKAHRPRTPIDWEALPNFAAGPAPSPAPVQTLAPAAYPPEALPLTQAPVTPMGTLDPDWLRLPDEWRLRIPAERWAALPEGWRRRFTARVIRETQEAQEADNPVFTHPPKAAE